MIKRYLLLFCCLLCCGMLLSSCGATSHSDQSFGLSEYCDEMTNKMFREDQTPIRLRYLCQNETSEEYEVSNVDTIRNIIRAMKDIHVIEETDVCVSDYDDIFVFVMQDATECTVAFNGHHFQENGKIYELSDDEELWRLAKELPSETEK